MKSAALVALFFILYSIFSVTSAHAQEPDPCAYDPSWDDQEAFNAFNNCAIQQDAYGAEVFTGAQIWATVDGLNMQIFGVSALHPQTDGSTAGRGALASASNLVASLYANPPASGVQYIASQIQKFNPVQPAYAQEGTGFDALKPVQDLWTVFRNASYVGFVIVFVIIGFMVMFRAHISPQAVATVQDSIPRIVIALILVTFSYAIAGLMIDLMFLIINVVISLLAQSGVLDRLTASDIIFQKSIIGVMVFGWDDVIGATARAIHDLLGDIIGGGSIANIIKFGGVLQWGIGGIAGLIVGIAALFIMFRIFVMLLMAYVMIILLTLLAPFYFLIQALPGNNGAKEWFKQMGANIAVFPAVALMILLAGIIGGITAFGGTGSGELTKEATTEALKFPLLLGGLDPTAIGKIIALGFLFMTPEAGKMVKEAIGAKGGPQFGGAGASALGAGAGMASWPARAAYGRYQEHRKNKALSQALRPRREPGDAEPGEDDDDI